LKWPALIPSGASGADRQRYIFMLAATWPDVKSDADYHNDVSRATLKSDSGDGLKACDLVWLLHVVGDVNQPLHASTRISLGEAGGNDVAFWWQLRLEPARTPTARRWIES
jgi:hypothetical protein